jgi:hypothetical protein
MPEQPPVPDTHAIKSRRSILRRDFSTRKTYTPPLYDTTNFLNKSSESASIDDKGFLKKE